ncbi:MAG: NADH-quinone oxidoreductase subunit NuoK [Bacteroidales bacterium]|jgi:NADH-quinone oxidoreductase subunit K|nr:NADH-quinone oxidoreductase subunit NuoK [Bacteroidales bacterium]
MFEGVPLTWFLITGTIMFFVGIYGFLVRKNLITILMSTELILNSVNINFVAFNKILYPGHLEGMFFTIFIIAVAAAEASVAIAIIINIYRRLVSINVEKMDEMKY